MKRSTHKEPDLFADSGAELHARGDSGAAAELRAIEADALLCRNRRDKALKEWEEADRKLVLGDTVSETAERRAWGRYLEQRELYEDATKQLAVFDKGVRPERREGEKIPVSEAKEIFAQLMLSIDLAIEQMIIADAQSAALCSSPEEFHLAHAGNYRAAKDGAISNARREGALPGWIL